MKVILLLSIFSLFLLIPNVYSQDISSNTCYNNVTSFTNMTIGGSSSNTFSYYTNCPSGCNNATGTCNGTNGSASINGMWLTFAIGSLFLVLGTVLGIPYGKMTGEEEIRGAKGGFDTTIVIKYIFFFVGLFFIYLSLSMAYNNVNLYGGEQNTLGGINTTLLVMIIVTVLFLFVFVIEILFWALKKSFTLKEEKKWGEQET
jgi:hypothetical protein